MYMFHAVICIVVLVMVLIDGFRKESLDKLYWLKVMELVVFLEIAGILLNK